MPKRSLNHINNESSMMMYLPKETFSHSSNRKVGKLSKKFQSLSSSFSTNSTSKWGLSRSICVYSPLLKDSKKMITSTFKKRHQLNLINKSPVFKKKDSDEENMEIYTISDISDFDLNENDKSFDYSL